MRMKLEEVAVCTQLLGKVVRKRMDQQPGLLDAREGQVCLSVLPLRFSG
jgi:hypothetical protein